LASFRFEALTTCPSIRGKPNLTLSVRFRICREGGRPVYMFTMANFGFALMASKTFELGFGEDSIFSLAMVLNCRRGLSPQSALIENKPPEAEPTQMKMEALGISSDKVWVIPSFEPPRFPSAKLFTLGLPLRLARLDQPRSALAVVCDQHLKAGRRIALTTDHMP
jgi:hypothetical protein